MRIRTHPLAQDFARRVLRDHPQFERETEVRWWQEYGSGVVRQVREIAYQSLHPGLEDDVANVAESICFGKPICPISFRHNSVTG